MKTGSSSASDVSSLRSSPDENIPSATSQTPSSVYSASNGGDSHKRKRSGTDHVGSSSQGHYDYSPPKRTEHSQHVVDRPLHVLGNADRQQDNNRHNGTNHQDQTWNQGHVQSVQPPTINGVGEEQWYNSPGAASQNSESMNGTNGVMPKRKRTKTACMTCRRRKKKCDEERPLCNNCIPRRSLLSLHGYKTAMVMGTTLRSIGLSTARQVRLDHTTDRN
jgi:hypothetical protein